VRAQFFAAFDDGLIVKTGFGQNESDRLALERLKKFVPQDEFGLDRRYQGQHVGQGRGGGIDKTLNESGKIRFSP
jgi:hypothetical protein